MWTYNYSDELYHHGILGMRWGIRRYQNKDGTLTSAGKKKRRMENQSNSKKEEKVDSTPKKKSVNELSDTELRERINRLQMEKNYLDLEKQVSSLKPSEVSTGRKFVNHVWNKVVAPAATDAGKKILTDWINKKGKDLLNLNESSEDSLDSLRKEVSKLKLKKQKIELDKYFEQEKNKDKKESKESADKKNKETSNSKDNKTKEDIPNVTGTVFGEGTSKRSSNDSKKSRSPEPTIYEAKWKDVPDNDVRTGESYVLALLDKKKK